MNNNIIWLASYPKSGNTWMRSILTSLVFSKDKKFEFELLKNITEFDIPFYYQFLLKNNNNDFNYLKNIQVISKYWIKAQEHFNLSQKTKFFKTHSSNISYIGKNYTDEKNTKGVIYLVRDPRDVIISYSKHLNKNIDDVIDIMQKENTITYSHKGNLPILLSRWDYHIFSWFNLKVPKIFIKYEHLLENTEGVVSQLIQFLNKEMNYDLDIKEDDINNVIQNTSFNNLQKKEKLEGFPEASKNSRFFRSGTKKQWENILDKKQQQKIIKSFKIPMEKFEYI